jgi:hypothetical protein
LPAERLFEILLNAAEYDVPLEESRQLIVNPWLVLDGRHLEHCGLVRPRFTIGHCLVVYFAWKGGLPIVTTNFDVLLEEAAEALGLEPLVEAGSDAQQWTERARPADGVVVWKPHGTIGRPETVRATIERTGLLRPQVARRLEQTFRSRTTLVTGYSGLDLDVFPALRHSRCTVWLTPRSARRRCLWL